MQNKEFVVFNVTLMPNQTYLSENLLVVERITSLFLSQSSHKFHFEGWDSRPTFKI